MEKKMRKRILPRDDREFEGFLEVVAAVDLDEHLEESREQRLDILKIEPRVAVQFRRGVS